MDTTSTADRISIPGPLSFTSYEEICRTPVITCLLIVVNTGDPLPPEDKRTAKDNLLY